MEYTPVAFITGAAVGIGEATALRLADDGFNIAINDLPREKDKLDTLAEAIIQKGKKAIVIVGDVTEEANVIKMVDDVVEQLGGLDVVRLGPS
jgi:NAD(P)-dependent dehydrogenase (short-subunit alcohol dehydrogenase family)